MYISQILKMKFQIKEHRHAISVIKDNENYSEPDRKDQESC